MSQRTPKQTPAAAAIGPANVPAAFWRTAARASAGEENDLGTQLVRLAQFVEDNGLEGEALEPLQGCLVWFVQFIEEAKPEEVELLREMLLEWNNCAGSLRTGNFFRATVEAVLAGDTAPLLHHPTRVGV